MTFIAVLCCVLLPENSCFSICLLNRTMKSYGTLKASFNFQVTWLRQYILMPTGTQLMLRIIRSPIIMNFKFCFIPSFYLFLFSILSALSWFSSISRWHNVFPWAYNAMKEREREIVCVRGRERERERERERAILTFTLTFTLTKCCRTLEPEASLSFKLDHFMSTHIFCSWRKVLKRSHLGG